MRPDVSGLRMNPDDGFEAFWSRQWWSMSEMQEVVVLKPLWQMRKVYYLKNAWQCSFREKAVTTSDWINRKSLICWKGKFSVSWLTAVAKWIEHRPLVVCSRLVIHLLLAE